MSRRPPPLSGSEPTFTNKYWGTSIGIGNNNCYAYAVGDYEKYLIKRVFLVIKVVVRDGITLTRTVRAYLSVSSPITLKRYTSSRGIRDVKRGTIR